MTADSSAHTPDDDVEHGVLADDGAVDTTGLGLLSTGTEQVRVVLPPSHDDLEDVVDDEEDVAQLFDTLATGEQPVAAASVLLDDAEDAIDDSDDAIDDADDEPGASPGEEVALEAEIVEVIDVPAGDDVDVDEDFDFDLDAVDQFDLELTDEPAADAAVLDEPTVPAPVDDDDDDDVVLNLLREEVDAFVADTRAPSEAEQDARAHKHPERTKPSASGFGARLRTDPIAGWASATKATPEDVVGEQKSAPSAKKASAAAATSPSRAAATPAAAKRDVHDLERVQTKQETPTLAAKRLDDFSGAARETPDLLTADRLLDPAHHVKPEPEGAWQHLIYSVTGGRINPGDSKRAKARKAVTARIAAPINGGSRFVPVLSRKGGVGKTTVTTLLGMALADARDDRVVAVDANPDRGTLAERIERSTQRTVRDLVRLRDEIRGFNDLSALVARDETRLDVLASAADPRVAEAFSDLDYRAVADVAGRFYSIVLTDTGTGIIHSVMGATLDLADQIVVVAGLSIDEARLASETLTWLETNGFAELAKDAVVVLNQTSAGAPVVRLNEVEAHFRSRVRDVVLVPYDPTLASGSSVRFSDLLPATRSAARELAALVVSGLRDTQTVR